MQTNKKSEHRLHFVLVQGIIAYITAALKTAWENHCFHISSLKINSNFREETPNTCFGAASKSGTIQAFLKKGQ